MFGAVLGDIIGSPYEFDRGNKSKKFPLFTEESHFTDDTVMTIAVAEACEIIRWRVDEMSDDEIRKVFVDCLQKWGNKYPDAGYGLKFLDWLASDNPQPYNSWGNGSAMRVSAVGWYFYDLETTRRVARLSADITHNHPEGIKGAEAVACVIYLSRSGYSKEYIKEFVVQEFGYDLSRTCREIRPTYRHVESCQETVPQAITAFLEGKNFIDVIRTAVSLGGDCDTLTAIAGSMAEAFYGVSKRMINECFRRLPEDILLIMQIFYTNYYLIKIVCFNKNKLCDGIPEPDCGGLPGPKIINETGLK